MTAILGISAFYHDSAAALVVDGEIVAAAQEERFTRRKHDPAFPARAVEYCLAEAGLSPEAIDFVGFYDKPLLKFERLLETYLTTAPAGFRSYLKALPTWLREKLYLPGQIRDGLGGKYNRRIIFTPHHESHAASAFFPSPFEEAALLTLDGVGEWATATLGVGEGNRIRMLREMRFPHSVGLLYSAFTYYCGFRVNSGEYKLMGLAPYGEPIYRDKILQHLVDLKEDGSLRLDMRYFNYCAGLTMTSPLFHELFGGPPRPPESGMEQRHMDLAASIQAVTEEIVLRCARTAHRLSGKKNLCLAGGVALNCVANGRLLREGPFERIWIQPAAGDAGGALGVALLTWHQLLDKPRTVGPSDSQRGSYLGPAFSNEQVRGFLDGAGAKAQRFDDEAELLARVAELLDGGNVIGWFHGRMEFGPRALGARSILGDARNREMQTTMNLKTKFRESFRPFAPVVIAEKAHEWFDVPEGYESPYMLLVADVSARHHIDAPADYRPPEDIPPALARLLRPRSTVPAITHVDYSARVQTVDSTRNPRFYRLMRAFESRTGCPVLVNTSFNVRGEPIVCTPEDAWRCFLATNMDALILEDYLILKSDQTAAPHHEVQAHLAKFQLD